MAAHILTFLNVVLVPAGPVQNLQATPAGVGSITVSWTAPSNAVAAGVTGYNIITNPGNILNFTTATSITISSLSPSINYWFSVTPVTP